jgi:hypothetical protein
LGSKNESAYARLRNRLSPRGNFHTVAEEVSSAYHYIADVDTDAEEYAAISCEIEIRLGQSGLRLHRALRGIHSASELREDTIARFVRDAAPVVTNRLVEDRPALGETLERADLDAALVPMIERDEPLTP